MSSRNCSDTTAGMRRGAEQRRVSRWRDGKERERERERVDGGGLYVLKLTRREKREKKNCVGGGGESLIWRGKREATATTAGCAPHLPLINFFALSFSWMMEGLLLP